MEYEEPKLTLSDRLKVAGLGLVAAATMYGMYYIIMSPITRTYPEMDVPGIVTERPAWLDRATDRLDTVVENLVYRR